MRPDVPNEDVAVFLRDRFFTDAPERLITTVVCAGNLLHILWNSKLFLEPVGEIGHTLLAHRMGNGILFVSEIRLSF